MGRKKNTRFKSEYLADIVSSVKDAITETHEELNDETSKEAKSINTDIKRIFETEIRPNIDGDKVFEDFHLEGKYDKKVVAEVEKYYSRTIREINNGIQNSKNTKKINSISSISDALENSMSAAAGKMSEDKVFKFVRNLAIAENNLAATDKGLIEALEFYNKNIASNEAFADKALTIRNALNERIVNLDKEKRELKQQLDEIDILVDDFKTNVKDKDTKKDVNWFDAQITQYHNLANAIKEVSDRLERLPRGSASDLLARTRDANNRIERQHNNLQSSEYKEIREQHNANMRKIVKKEQALEEENRQLREQLGQGTSKATTESLNKTYEELDEQSTKIEKRIRELLTNTSILFSDKTQTGQNEKYYTDQLEILDNYVTTVQRLKDEIAEIPNQGVFNRRNTVNLNNIKTIEQLISGKRAEIKQVYDSIDFESQKQAYELERKLTQRSGEIVNRILGNEDFKKYGDNSWLTEYMNIVRSDTREIDIIYDEFIQRLEENKKKILAEEAETDRIYDEIEKVKTYLRGISLMGNDEYEEKFAKYSQLLDQIPAKLATADDIISEIAKQENVAAEAAERRAEADSQAANSNRKPINVINEIGDSAAEASEEVKKLNELLTLKDSSKGISSFANEYRNLRSNYYDSSEDGVKEIKDRLKEIYQRRKDDNFEKAYGNEVVILMDFLKGMDESLSNKNINKYFSNTKRFKSSQQQLQDYIDFCNLASSQDIRSNLSDWEWSADYKGDGKSLEQLLDDLIKAQQEVVEFKKMFPSKEDLTKNLYDGFEEVGNTYDTVLQQIDNGLLTAQEGAVKLNEELSKAVPFSDEYIAKRDKKGIESSVEDTIPVVDKLSDELKETGQTGETAGNQIAEGMQEARKEAEKAGEAVRGVNQNNVSSDTEQAVAPVTKLGEELKETGQQGENVGQQIADGMREAGKEIEKTSNETESFNNTIANIGQSKRTIRPNTDSSTGMLSQSEVNNIFTDKTPDLTPERSANATLEYIENLEKLEGQSKETGQALKEALDISSKQDGGSSLDLLSSELEKARIEQEKLNQVNKEGYISQRSELEQINKNSKKNIPTQEKENEIIAEEGNVLRKTSEELDEYIKGKKLLSTLRSDLFDKDGNLLSESAKNFTIQNAEGRTTQVSAVPVFDEDNNFTGEYNVRTKQMTNYDKLVQNMVKSVLDLRKAEHGLNTETNDSNRAEWNKQLREARQRVIENIKAVKEYANTTDTFINDSDYNSKYTRKQFVDDVSARITKDITNLQIKQNNETQKSIELEQKRADAVSKLRNEMQLLNKEISGSPVAGQHSSTLSQLEQGLTTDNLESTKAKFDILKQTISAAQKLDKTLTDAESKITKVRQKYDPTLAVNESHAIKDKADLDELDNMYSAIVARIDEIKAKGEASTQEINELFKTISEFDFKHQDITKKYKITSGELSGTDLESARVDMIGTLDKLIKLSEKYGSATEDLTNKLKEQQKILKSEDTPITTADITNSKALRKSAIGELRSVQAEAAPIQKAEAEAVKYVNQLYDERKQNIKEIEKFQLENLKTNTTDEERAVNEERIREITARTLAIKQELAAADATLVNREKEIHDYAVKSAEAVQKSRGGSRKEQMQSLSKMLSELKEMATSGKYVQTFNESLLALSNTIKETSDKKLNLQELREEVARISESFDGLKSNSKLKLFISASEQSIYKLSLKIEEFKNKNSAMGTVFAAQFEELSQRLKHALDTKASQKEIQDLATEFFKLEVAVEKAGKTGASFISTLGKRIKQMSTNWLAMYFSMYDITRYIRTTADSVIQIDTALTELRKVSDASTERLAQNFQKSSETAQELGSTIKDVINITADWSRLGFNVDEAEELARTTTLFQNVGENISADDASSYLISTMQGFQMAADQSEEIVDKYNEVNVLPPYVVIHMLCNFYYIEVTQNGETPEEDNPVGKILMYPCNDHNYIGNYIVNVTPLLKGRGMV